MQLLHEDCLFTYPSLSIARHSFIQLSELEQRGVDKIAQALKQRQEDSKPLKGESDVLTTRPQSSTDSTSWLGCLVYLCSDQCSWPAHLSSGQLVLINYVD